MNDERSDPAHGGFLPPEPGGREPDLQGFATPPPTPQTDQDWQPPAQATPQAQAWQQPQAGREQRGQQWGYPQQQVPDNGSAVAGFTLSVAAGALLLISIGFSSLVSVLCAGLGIFYSRRGRSRVDRGETPKHRGLAQAGFIVGIVSLVLAVLATAFWTFFLILYATDDEFRRDFESDPRFNGTEAAIRIGAVAGRALWSLVA